jgi:hypothetical protein
VTSETEQPTARADVLSRIECHVLALRVDTGVGATADAQSGRLGVEHSHRSKHFTGDGARIALYREPRKGLPVVGDLEKHAEWVSRARALV